MIRFFRTSLILLALSVVGLAALSSTLAAQHVAANKLVVKITAVPGSATIWGSVKITYSKNGKSHTVGHCKSANCTFHTTVKTKLSLTESAKSPTTWPFKKWTVITGGKTEKSTANKEGLTIKGGSAVVTATYHLPGA